jgi:hypothetical protein
VRARFTDYVARFVRLAARYDEEVNGLTKIGFPTLSFSERYGDRPRLGSGAVFNDESAAAREMMANASRIEAWKKTKMCEYYEPVRCYRLFIPRPRPLTDFTGLSSVFGE